MLNLRTLRRATALALPIAISALCVTEATAEETTPLKDEIYDLRIVTMDATRAIQEFGAQSGVQILIDGATLSGKQLNSVTGRHSIDEGLRQMLLGSGLSYHYVGERGVALVPEEPIAQVGIEPEARPLPRIRLTEAEVAVSPPPLLRGSEITVTARKREEPLQEIGIAVDAFSTRKLLEENVTSLYAFSDLTLGVNVVKSAGSYHGITIDGIYNFPTSSFGDATNPIVYNEVALSRPTQTVALTYDTVAEIVRGPQGLLYGRNASGGVIKFTSKRPEDVFTAGVHLDAGNYERRAIDAYVNVPLGDTFAVRLAGQTVEREGYVSDGTDDEDTDGVRLTAKWEPSDSFSMLFFGDYARDTGSGVGATVLAPGTNKPIGSAWQGIGDQGGIITGPTFNASFGPSITPSQDNEFSGATIQAEWVTDAGTLTAIPGCRKTRTGYLSQVILFYIGEFSDSDFCSAELRWSSPDRNRFRYTGGLYGFDEENTSSQVTDQNTRGSSLSNYRLRTESVAAFLQVGYAFNSRWRGTAGVRYGDEEKTAIGSTLQFTQRFPPPAVPTGPSTVTNVFTDANGNLSFDSVTGTVGIEFDLQPDKLLYGSFATGSKGGGFFAAPSGNTFNEERTKAVAIGSKNQFFDGAWTLNGELKCNEFTDGQLPYLSTRVTPQGIPVISQVIENIGDSTTCGVQLTNLLRPTNSTLIAVDVSYLKGEYDSLMFSTPLQAGPPPYGCSTTLANGAFNVDCGDRPTLQTPEWSGLLMLEQRVNLPWGGATLIANANTKIEGPRELRFNFLQGTRSDSYTRSNARLTLRSGDQRWSFSVWIHNIENKAVLANAYPSPFVPGLITGNFKDPQTYGASATYDIF